MNSYQCSKCPNPILNVVQVFGTVLLVFAYIMFMIIINIRKTEESEFSVMMRILTNYLQLITVSVSMTADYPSLIFTIAGPIQSFGGSSEAFMSFDCFITEYEIKGPFQSNSVLKLFILMLLPVLLFLCVTVFWVILYHLRRDWVKDMTRNLVISFISIVYLLHPKLTEQSLGFFRCVEVDEDRRVARIDTDIE